MVHYPECSPDSAVVRSDVRQAAGCVGLVHGGRHMQQQRVDRGNEDSNLAPRRGLAVLYVAVGTLPDKVLAGVVGVDGPSLSVRPRYQLCDVDKVQAGELEADMHGRQANTIGKCT